MVKTFGDGGYYRDYFAGRLDVRYAIIDFSVLENRGHFALQMLWLMLINVVLTTVQIIIEHSVLAMINFMVILCLPILWQYNGQRGRSPQVNAFLKWFFYLYYPLHLLVIGILFHNGIFVIG